MNIPINHIFLTNTPTVDIIAYSFHSCVAFSIYCDISVSFLAYLALANNPLSHVKLAIAIPAKIIKIFKKIYRYIVTSHKKNC